MAVLAVPIGELEKKATLKIAWRCAALSVRIWSISELGHPTLQLLFLPHAQSAVSTGRSLAPSLFGRRAVSLLLLLPSNIPSRAITPGTYQLLAMVRIHLIQPAHHFAWDVMGLLPFLNAVQRQVKWPRNWPLCLVDRLFLETTTVKSKTYRLPSTQIFPCGPVRQYCRSLLLRFESLLQGVWHCTGPQDTQ